MTRLAEALDALMLAHRRQGSPVPDYLAPPADPDRVRAAVLTATGFAAHDDLVDLFAWHDGIDEDAWRRDAPGRGFARIAGDTYFGGVDHAVEMYRGTVDIVQSQVMGPVPEPWRRSWFPAFCGGEPYGVELDGTGGTRGVVYTAIWHPPESDPEEPAFASLLHLVESMTRRFEEGGYRWDRADRWLDEDESVLARLRRVEREELARLRSA